MINLHTIHSYDGYTDYGFTIGDREYWYDDSAKEITVTNLKTKEKYCNATTHNVTLEELIGIAVMENVRELA